MIDYGQITLAAGYRESGLKRLAKKTFNAALEQAVPGEVHIGRQFYRQERQRIAGGRQLAVAAPAVA